MIVLVCYSLYCYVSSLIVCYVCMMYVYLYRTLTPYNLLPYNHNTYNAIVCDMRIYGHSLGIVGVGSKWLYRLCISIVYYCIVLMCVVYNVIFLHVIRLCTTLFYTIHLRRIGCVQYN